MISEDKHTQSSDRFELEQLILRCWGVSDDLDLVISRLNVLSVNEVNTHLEAIKGLYNLRFEALFGLFEKMLKEKQIH